MPTYQYNCTACGRALEVVQKFTDASLTECPECSGRLKKVFNAVGVVFKGSGFYRTDSRNASSSSTGASGDKSNETSSSTTGSDSGGSTSGSSDSGSSSTTTSTSSDTKPKAAASTAS